MFEKSIFLLLVTKKYQNAFRSHAHKLRQMIGFVIVAGAKELATRESANRSTINVYLYPPHPLNSQAILYLIFSIGVGIVERILDMFVYETIQNRRMVESGYLLEAFRKVGCDLAENTGGLDGREISGDA